MILITGATGALGSATIDFLLKKTTSDQIAALVRDPEKATNLRAKGIEIRVGDYNNPASLEAAFRGVDKLLFVSSNDLTNRAVQHQNVVNAAKSVGVGHVVYTSFDRKTEDGSSPVALVADSHLKAEQWLRESGIPYTFMLNGLYADLLPMFLGEKVLETGVVFQPSGSGKAAFTLRNDMAEVAAELLTTEGHAGKSYRIVAEEALSYADIAALLAAQTGKDVQHVSPTVDAYIQTLVGAGVPEGLASFFATFSKAIEVGEFDRTDSDIEQLIGRKPTTVRAFLASVYA